jgi:hypothetical protein
MTKQKQPRKPGYLKGKIKVADDFDAPLSEDILEGFADKAKESTKRLAELKGTEKNLKNIPRRRTK